MATRERLIVEAVIAALRDASIPGIGADRVYDERNVALDDDALPAIDVESGDGVAEEQGIRSPVTLHTFDVHVSIVAVATPSAAAMKVADPIVGAVHRVVMGAESVRVLVRRVRLQASRVDRASTGSGALVRKRLTYVVDYTASTADLEVAA
jgi:hypothetical protein